MKTEQAKPGEPVNTVLPVMFGVLGAFIISMILLLIFSFIMTVRDLPQAAIAPVACVSIGFGAFFGGFITARMKGSKGLLLGAISGFAFFVILWLIGLIMGESAVGVLMIIKILISLGVGSIGGIAGVNFRRRKSRHTY